MSGDALSAALGGEVPLRSGVPDEFKWKLSDIYPSDEDWERDFSLLKERMPGLEAMSGALGESAENLLSCLRMRDEIAMVMEKIYTYAMMKSHEDTALSACQNLFARAGALMAEFGGASSFITPEIIAIPEDTLGGFIDPANTGSDFDDYRFMFKEIARLKEHVLSPPEEELLARVSETASVPENAFSMLTNADMRFPVIRDEEDREIELTEERYIKYISSTNRRVRKEAFDGLYKTYEKYNNTLGATFNGMLKSSRFLAQSRRYGSDIERALDAGNIPLSVYDNLIATAEDNLGHLHRYMALRKRVLGLDELRMYDIYNPLAENPYKDIPWETAREMAAEALVPLGAEYMARFREGLDSGWIDVHSSKGKRGGAYSCGVYGVHPFILLNWNGELMDVMTLAHEMGHALHSYFSHKTQPYPTADYTIFCAEVASTANEELALDYMIRSERDAQKKIYLLNQRLERVRATVYRQTMFASFEREIHGRNERGEDTTAEALGHLWLSLNEKYFGPEVIVDELIRLEWSRIPHFYSPFYVYQYATGYSAAASLARKITEEGAPAVERYMRFLSSGGSDYSIELLKQAGVDMSSPEPIRDALGAFAATLDEMERMIEAC